MDTSFNLGSGREIFAAAALVSWLKRDGFLGEVEELLQSLTMTGIFPIRRGIEALQVSPTAAILKRRSLPCPNGPLRLHNLDQLPPEAAVGYTLNEQGQVVENVYAVLETALDCRYTVRCMI